MKTKRFLAVILSVVMMLSLLPSAVFAAEEGAEVRYSVDGGVTWAECNLIDVLWNCYGKDAKVELLRDVVLTDKNWSEGNHFVYGNTITIDGQGHTVKRGENIRKLVTVAYDNSVLILKDIVIDGGAVWSEEDVEKRTNSGLSYGGNAHLFDVYSGAKLVLEDGVILQNSDLKDTSYGAAISIGSDGAGTVVMKEGAIIRNCAASDGAAVCVFEAGSFIMEGGSITGNYGSKSSGGIYSIGNVTLSGGKISGNATGGHSAGILVYGGTVSVSGAPVVKENMSKDERDNIFLNSGKAITITGALASGAELHVSSVDKVTGDEATVIAKSGEGYAVTASDTTKLVYDAVGYKIGQYGGQGILVSNPPKVIVNGVNLATDEDNSIEIGEGSAVYDPETFTVTLTNAVITVATAQNVKAGIYFSDLKDNSITVKLVGENSITLGDGNGIWCYSEGGLKIAGDGSLDIAVDGSYPRGIYNAGSICVENTKIDFIAGNGTSQKGSFIETKEFGSYDIIIDNSEITSLGTERGLFADDDLKISNSTVSVKSADASLYGYGVFIENSTVVSEAEWEDCSAICSWAELALQDSEVEATSPGNGIYSFGKVNIDGGEAAVTSSLSDAFVAYNGIIIDNKAKLVCKAKAAGIYTGGALSVADGYVKSEGDGISILARKLSDNAEDNSPQDAADAIILSDGMKLAGGAVVKTNDWQYTEVWDDWEFDYAYKWQSSSRPADEDGNALTSATIYRAHTITFDANGGAADKESDVSDENGKLTSLPEATREGYTFNGWFTETDDGEEITEDTVFENNTTIYAQWTEVPKKPSSTGGGGLSAGGDKSTDGKDDLGNDTSSAEGSGEDIVLPSEEDGKTESSFSDVASGTWYHEAAEWMNKNGYMNGTAAGRFSPDIATTRGMVVTILWRMSGEPAPQSECTFDDVKEGSYYENAIAWAQENGVVTGHSDTVFAPDELITREQLAAIIFRNEVRKGMDAVTLEENLTSFTDADNISAYAVTAMNWAVGQGIISGTGVNTLSPRKQATRAECAVILYRMHNK